MKDTYYVLVLDNNTQNLTIDSLGVCLSEDADLTEANKYQKKHKVSVIWTTTANNLKTLKESLKNYEF